MNIKQAKAIRIEDLVTSLGYEVIKIHKGCELRFTSPLREERTPSFDVNTRLQCWNDLGTGQGGDIIDFGVEYLRSRGRPCSKSDALRWLADQTGQASLYPNKSTPASPRVKSSSYEAQLAYEEGEENNKLLFLKAIPIRKRRIYEYLEGRGISRALADKYLLEIHYRNLELDRDFWGFGISNMSDEGYELRSASDEPKFRTAFHRDISVLKGIQSEEGRGGAVNVVEGMLDALSLMTMLNTTQLTNDTIILHSLSSYKRSVNYIYRRKYEQIHLFLDNDESGRRTTDRYTHGEERKDTLNTFAGFGDQVIDHGPEYFPYNDLNDALQAGHRTWPIAVTIPGFDRQ